MIGLFVCALLVGFGASSGATESHPMSRSSSRVDVEEGTLRWTLRVQSESIHEVLPALDLDGDGALQRSESDGGRSEIIEYLSARYQLRLTEDKGDPFLGECVYAGAPRGSDLEGSDLEGSDEWVELVWEGSLESELAGVGIAMDLFTVTSPNHVDVFELRRRGRLSYTALFSAERPGAWILFSEDDVMSLMDWISMGFSHILSGFDHLAFLAALLVCVRGPKQIALVITAFTLSHSLTLGLAALDVFRLPGRFVELVIALSVTYVALGGFAKEPRRGLWIEAMIFGLVHGLGFASFLGEALVMEERRIGALLGFNLGVEVGQLVFVLPIAGMLFVARRRSGSQSPWLVPRLVRRVVAGLVACAGVFWFAERAGLIF